MTDSPDGVSIILIGKPGSGKSLLKSIIKAALQNCKMADIYEMKGVSQVEFPSPGEGIHVPERTLRKFIEHGEKE